MSRVDEIRARLSYARRAFSWLGSAGVAMDDVTYLLDVAAAAEELLEMHLSDPPCPHQSRLLAALNRAPSSTDTKAPAATGASSSVTGGARPRTKGYQGRSVDSGGPPPPISPTPMSRRRRPW